MGIIKKLESNAFEPTEPYWVPGDPECNRYCSDCIDTSGEYGEDWDGGFSFESDGSEFCAKCGNPVEYSLTDYGLECELSHFEEYGFDPSSPTECYEVLAVYYGLYYEEHINRFWSMVNSRFNR